nr:MAG TPA: hypothetical protein [Caudoviricetes sp.]
MSFPRSHLQLAIKSHSNTSEYILSQVSGKVVVHV